MGILSSISNDIECLVLDGYNDNYISLSVGVDLKIIQPIINYYRNKHNFSYSKKEDFRGMFVH